MAALNNAVSKNMERLYVLDGLRGICALAIAFYHFHNWSDAENSLAFFQIGYFGVYIFFILSGFSLWYVYESKPLTIPLFRSFFVARVARIVPLYFLMCTVLGVMTLVSQKTLSFEWVYWYIINITFLFGFMDPGQTALVPGGWSLGIEWSFYLIFPLLLLFASRLRALIVLLVFFCLFNQAYIKVLLSSPNMDIPNPFGNLSLWYSYTLLPAFMVYFMAGITMAACYKKLEIYRPVFSKMSIQLLLRILIIYCLGFVFLFPAKTPQTYLYGAPFPFLLAASMIMVLAGALCVRLNSLEQKLYQFLGDISFGLYLIYYFIYQLITLSSLENHPAVSFFATALLAIAVSYMLYRFYEMPARRWLIKKFG